jgi:hypothetical protein
VVDHVCTTCFWWSAKKKACCLPGQEGPVEWRPSVESCEEWEIDDARYD